MNGEPEETINRQTGQAGGVRSGTWGVSGGGENRDNDRRGEGLWNTEIEEPWDVRALYLSQPSPILSMNNGEN